MGHRHDKADLLAAAVSVALDEGLAKLSFGRVAERAGISDRMVVYYFPSKTALIGEVLVEVGANLRDTLAPALEHPALDHRDVIGRVWSVVAGPQADPIFALYFEAAGQATAGREPYRTIVPQLVDAWIDWVASLLTGSATTRRAEAAAAVAVLDGLLLVRQLGGHQQADAAARLLGEP